jgi:ribosomal protein L13
MFKQLHEIGYDPLSDPGDKVVVAHGRMLWTGNKEKRIKNWKQAVRLAGKNVAKARRRIHNRGG